MRITLCPSLGLFLFLSVTAMQSSFAAGESPESSPATDEPAVAKVKIKAFEFPGGTLVDFTKALEKPPFPWTTAPIVPFPGSNPNGIEIPAFKLTDTTELEVLNAARFLIGGYLAFRQDGKVLRIAMVNNPPTKHRGQSADEAAPNDVKVLSFDFPGGTFEEFAEQLRKPPFKWGTISVPQWAANQEIPAFQLKNTTAGEILTVASSLSDLRSQGTTSFLRIYSPRLSSPPKTGVFSLRKILGAYPFEDINALISKALESTAKASPKIVQKAPDLSFHKETQTLIAVGTSEQIDLVGKVIASLNDSVPAVSSEPPKPAATP